MKLTDKTKSVLTGVLLWGMLIFILLAFIIQFPAGDELVFIRITENLPTYDSRIEWYSLDGKTDPNTFLSPSPYFEKAYELPFWSHPSVANYLAYPMVKLLFSEEDVEGSFIRLRLIAWFMLSFSVLVAVYLVQKKNRLFSLIPLVASFILFTKVGNNWFYHDMFMLVFLMIALLMRHTKYERYIYLPLALMVGTKIYAVLFLIPFIIENRKTALCSLVLIPYFVQSYFVTGEFFYSVIHWLNLGGFTAERHYNGFMGQLGVVATSALKVVFFLIVTIPPFVYTAYNAIRRRGSWFLPSLFVITSIFGLGWGTYYYQMLPMMIVGMLIMGEAVIQFKARKAEALEYQEEVRLAWSYPDER